MTTEHKPHSGRDIVNILKAGMPWPEPSDGGWHWAMPPIRSMEKARKVLPEVERLVEQLETLREAVRWALHTDIWIEDNPYHGPMLTPNGTTKTQVWDNLRAAYDADSNPAKEHS